MMKLRVSVVLLTLSVVLGSNSLGWGASLDQKINKTNKKLQILRQKENTALGHLVETQEKMDKINADLNTLQIRASKSQQKMDVISSQLDKNQDVIQKVRGNMSSYQGVLNTRLVSIYKYGYQSYLEILFGVNSFSEFISRFEMVGNFVHKDMEMIKTLQQQHDLIANKQQKISEYQEDLERQQRVLARLRSQAEQKHNSLRAQANLQKNELNRIMDDRKTLEAALDEMEATSRSMEAEIRGASNSTVALGTGSYLWPSTSRGRISSYFGHRFHPVLKKYRYHSGYDIALPKGTPVLATDDGVVIWSGNKGGYGKLIMLDHGLGFSSVYGHNSALLVSAGQRVTKGQRIALVGSTGMSTGPHIHFEIRKDGVCQDPGRYIR